MTSTKIAGGPEAMQRFWVRVGNIGTGECWVWKGTLSENGYGSFKLGVGHSVGAHRFAWEQFYGQVPEGMYVCHKCDVRACVNPGHLFIGTARDNANDRDRKGRAATGNRNGSRLYPEKRPRGEAMSALVLVGQYGEGHAHAKMTDEKVREARVYAEAHGIRPAARKYGVSHTAMLAMVRRKTWKHVV